MSLCRGKKCSSHLLDVLKEFVAIKVSSKYKNCELIVIKVFYLFFYLKECLITYDVRF